MILQNPRNCVHMLSKNKDKTRYKYLCTNNIVGRRDNNRDANFQHFPIVPLTYLKSMLGFWYNQKPLFNKDVDLNRYQLIPLEFFKNQFS